MRYLGAARAGKRRIRILDEVIPPLLERLTACGATISRSREAGEPSGLALRPGKVRGYPARVAPLSRSREAFERRFGALGTGQRSLSIAGVAYDLPALMERLGLAHQDCRTIDAWEIQGGFVIRYLDAEEQRIVAYEFDADFRYLGETRIHVAEWIGEQLHVQGDNP